MDILRRNIVTDFCKRNNITIKYIDSELADLELDGKLFVLLDRSEIALKDLEVYKQNLVTIITDRPTSWPSANGLVSNGHNYLAKCKAPLIGVDITLFNSPEFPFANNKPKCFYKVKVDDNQSALDAWQDERLRWEMIMNRINYAGGFIDNKSILSAMNITRTCKQPSWFSKVYARQLINKYITTSTIVDGFAGYGARYDAAKEEKKKYYGIDFNAGLVAWHKECGRDIVCADATSWHIQILEPYSVFICPPYSDPKTGRCFEDYNFEGFDAAAKGRTQEDWLDIMIKNFPNATEYLMVCKVVDRYKDYIIEKKENKSHFGKNNEYVIRITNSK